MGMRVLTGIRELEKLGAGGTLHERFQGLHFGMILNCMRFWNEFIIRIFGLSISVSGLEVWSSRFEP